jgi:S-adenosylmethionine:diacylglycerol 3-amino-3-carboxypropyl transferase
MYEDPSIEIEAFAPSSRVFCIASAGCTALALSAAGHDVTAVDLNPQQILYVQARLTGAPMRKGAAERLLSRARASFPALSWTKPRLHQFLSMRDPSKQLQYWRRKLNTKRCRIAVDTVLSGALLRLAYRSPFLECVPRRFGSVVRARLERTWSNHANNSNPYAWRFFLGEPPSVLEQPMGPIRFVCEDAATYLETCKPASFDAFSLSNILDGVPSGYARRLCMAIERAASAGAVVVTRSFAEPHRALNNNLAARDRSMLWGTVSVTEVANLCSTF